MRINLEVPRSTGNLMDHLIPGLPMLQVLRTGVDFLDHLICGPLPLRGRHPVTIPAKAQLAHPEVAARDVAREVCDKAKECEVVPVYPRARLLPVDTPPPLEECYSTRISMESDHG